VLGRSREVIAAVVPLGRGDWDRAVAICRDVLDRLTGAEERHYCVPVLQWAASFFAEHGRSADLHACATTPSLIADTTAQPEAVATLAHALGETQMAGQPQAAARGAGPRGRPVPPARPAAGDRAVAVPGGSRGGPAGRPGPRARAP
jgi:hypothetical protein